MAWGNIGYTGKPKYRSGFAACHDQIEQGELEAKIKDEKHFFVKDDILAREAVKNKQKHTRKR